MNKPLRLGCSDNNRFARSRPFISGMITSVISRWISSEYSSANSMARPGVFAVRDPVIQFLEHRSAEVQNGGLVLHEQYGFPVGADRLCGIFHANLCYLASVTRQKYLEGRSFARFAVHVDKAQVLFDDAVYCGQPEAGSPAHALGCEERLEEVLDDFFFHAVTVVADGQHDVFAGQDVRMIGAVRFIESDIPCLDGDFADSGNGVPGVNAQVSEKLIDLAGVHFYGP